MKLAGKALTINPLPDGSNAEVDTEDGFWRFTSPYSTWMNDREGIGNDFLGYVTGAYKRNGPVFTCILVRLLAYTEARFMFQQLNDWRPGELFGGVGLELLERPWRNGTTGELLARMEQDASLAGNFYATTVGTGTDRRIRRLRPDWVTVVSGIRGDADGSPLDMRAEVLGYIYDPGRDGSLRNPPDPVLLSVDQVVHYSPIPDPEAQWRGMSWLTPVLNEISADSAATKHKLKFFQNGATPSFAVKYDASIQPDKFQQYVQLFNDQMVGADNAYRVLHLGGGADPTVVGSDLKQLDFKATQGAGETRIAAASGCGAIIARLSEGMQGSALNAGNYSAAKRQFGDLTVRPLWRITASSLAKFTKPPANSRLWYDARDVAFLAEDEKDAAEIAWLEAQTIARLTEAGYEPASVIASVRSRDYSLMKHTGKFSVQLQGVQ